MENRALVSSRSFSVFHPDWARPKGMAPATQLLPSGVCLDIYADKQLKNRLAAGSGKASAQAFHKQRQTHRKPGERIGSRQFENRGPADTSIEMIISGIWTEAILPTESAPVPPGNGTSCPGLSRCRNGDKLPQPELSRWQENKNLPSQIA